MDRKFLFWVLVALNLLDVWLTSIHLSIGGEEANPWVNMFIIHFGYIGMLIAKIPFLALLGTLIYMYWGYLSTGWKKGTTNIIYVLVLTYVLLNCYSFGLLFIA